MNEGCSSKWVVAFVALVTVAACAAPERPPVGQAIQRDSAGVTIVESSGSTWQPSEAWLIGWEPLLQIGSSEGEEEYSFGFLSDAVRLSDGRVVVLDQMAAALRAFDGKGAAIGDWARKGDGPGELGRPRKIIRLPNDSIVVEEFGGLASVFAPDGGFVRRFRVPVEEWSMGDLSREVFSWSPYGVVDRLEDGSYVAQLRAWIDRGTGRHPERTALARFTEDGAGDTLTVVTAGRYRVETEGRGFSIVGTHFDPQVLTGAHATQVYVADGSSFSYQVYSIKGDLVKVVRLLWPRTVVDQDLKDRWKEDRSRYWGPATEPGVPQGRLQQLFEETEYPDSLPALAALRIDSQGNVWGEAMPTRTFSTPSPDQYVFDSAGVFLGVVEAPPGLRITEIGADYLIGVWRDENEVDFVKVYGLKRGQ